MKKTLLKSWLFMLGMGLSLYASAQLLVPQNPSPAASVSQTVGLTKISIDYSRPHVEDGSGNDRSGNIWGGLVPYDWSDPLPGFGSGNKMPWRAGANMNTVIKFSSDVSVEGKKLSAGAYGLHLLVGENGTATWIFSSNTTSWGSYFYDEKEDVLRVEGTATDHDQTPRLTYNFNNLAPTSAIINLDWEKKRFSFNVSIDKSTIIASFSDQLRSATGFNWQNFNNAANYSLSNNIALEKGLEWAEAAVAANPGFATNSTKANLLAALGKTAEAEKVMNSALDDPAATPADFYTYGRQLIAQDKDQDALVIFEKLNKKWPENWLAPHGLARAYSALGDYKKALKHERKALEKAPAGSKGFLEGYLKTLEEGKDFN